METNAERPLNILAFAGSTRKDSVNKKLIREAVEFAKQAGAKVTLVDLSDYPIPLYDGDLEAESGMPSHARELRRLLIEHPIIFISSPEYNSSLPAVLKNTIDWTTRKEDGSGGSLDSFKGKTFVIMGASPGSRGGARALIHLRSILESIGGHVVPEQVTLPNAYEAFDEEGHLKDAKLRLELQALIESALQKN